MGIGASVKRMLGRVVPSAVLVSGRRETGNRIALTFDDGPHPEYTPRILDCLSARCIAATFFLQGAEACKYPGLVRELVERSHQVGNHGFRHLNARLVDPIAYVDEVERTQSLLRELTSGAASMDFRPPHGVATARTFLPLTRRGYRFVFWSRDSCDSFIRTPRSLADHVRSAPLVRGEILLLHEDYAHTVEALPEMVDGMMAQGFRFARTDEW